MPHPVSSHTTSIFMTTESSPLERLSLAPSSWATSASTKVQLSTTAPSDVNLQALLSTLLTTCVSAGSAPSTHCSAMSLSPAASKNSTPSRTFCWPIAAVTSIQSRRRKMRLGKLTGAFSSSSCAMSRTLLRMPFTDPSASSSARWSSGLLNCCAAMMELQGPTWFLTSWLKNRSARESCALAADSRRKHSLSARRYSSIMRFMPSRGPQKVYLRQW
mmetsp:Transcript_12122/g.51019  ORF Transcript_12122/g.51019 Transcript_12122/m.51019 type:complete len:217 (+) Transcript_12122:631-1281(+)